MLKATYSTPESHHWLISGDEVTSAATSSTAAPGFTNPHTATPTATTMIRGTTTAWTRTRPVMPASTETTQTAAITSEPTSEGSPNAVCTAAPAPAPAPSASTYTVLAGDGWWIISYRTGVSASVLQSINGMTSSTVLHPGMVLKTSVVASSAPAPAPAPVTNGKQAAVDFVRSKVQNPSSYYLWGGNGPYGFDCSGLTQQAMAKAGISIPRRAGDQYNAAKSYVPISQAQPGDLVFYANQSTGRIYHVAMYMGGGQLAHALNEDAGLLFTSTTIMKSDMLAVAARY